MRLTKYEHACFTVEKNGKMLIVDPGIFTTDLIINDHVSAIVITHEHPDHFDPKLIDEIASKNPELIIFAHETITNQLNNKHSHKAVSTNTQVDHDEFNLKFFGGEHAIIHPDIPRIANLGVMINDAIYYPGDSFVEPNVPVKVLALPVGAPWLKASEMLDFLLKIKPQIVFPTHDAVLSDLGKSLPDRYVPMFADKVGGTYNKLTEPLEITES